MIDYDNHRRRNYRLAVKLYRKAEPIKLTESNQATMNPEILFCSADQRSLIRDSMLLNNMPAFADTVDYEITDFQAALAPARFRGFAFAEKRWSFFLVENSEPVAWMQSKFSELEVHLPYKETIQALVHEHQVKEPSINQLSKKGRGVVILLYGPPGTGKTLTAGVSTIYLR
jgi:hypothetical protein